MARTRVRSVRLPLERWAELEYAARLHGRCLNDEVKARLDAAAVPVPAEVAEGQMALFGEAVTQRRES